MAASVLQYSLSFYGGMRMEASWLILVSNTRSSGRRGGRPSLHPKQGVNHRLILPLPIAPKQSKRLLPSAVNRCILPFGIRTETD